MYWKELKDNPRLKNVFDQRAVIVRLTREFFWSQNFIETETSTAVKAPDQEPHLDPIMTKFHDENKRETVWYLQTSPEFAMKKLLGAGYEKIFQICKCFRDEEESGVTHNPEFTMIEWYRTPGAYEEIMTDTENLFKYIAEKTGVSLAKYNGCEIDMTKKWERVRVKDLWQKYIGVNLDDYLDEKKMAELVRERGYQVNEGDDFNDLFHKIFLNEIEPHIGKNNPTIVYEYPAQLAALARLCPADARYAERFELYICGLEIANCFGELTDGEAQLKRFEHEQGERVRLGKSAMPIDKELINALKCLPNAAGVALGMDRMIMLFTGARNINEVIFQTVKDQLEY
ncbi:MAG: EF-P lysine aminoacylase GenX [Candidatus Magasanikbacteria bacterium RIFOXYA2_FULL_44_8]|uniref:EF-P lysine aminoacylase GenX n=1 Tax=Candidatus Magasanikbacteria bacterium RIFOXYA2_FULL_44_8 TaxID=1798696 RepID=A0A1F6NJX8_9BACT|nr:MAG: EF-P lysine aminoacylase GenX [Candidatus Magasanikbacteria bacterium RIFOXYA2_FULL_44_8]